MQYLEVSFKWMLKKISGRSRSRRLRVHDGYDFVQSTRDMY
jgi:hypothetical protein